MKLIFNILWLYVNMLTLSTPYQIEKDLKKFIDELSQRDERSKRIGRRENIFQNKCVSSQQIFLRERALP